MNQIIEQHLATVGEFEKYYFDLKNQCHHLEKQIQSDQQEEQQIVQEISILQVNSKYKEHLDKLNQSLKQDFQEKNEIQKTLKESEQAKLQIESSYKQLANILEKENIYNQK